MIDIKNGIVINTSPWIALSICGKTELLKQLYEEVYMPIGVKEEVLIGGEEKRAFTQNQAFNRKNVAKRYLD